MIFGHSPNTDTKLTHRAIGTAVTFVSLKAKKSSRSKQYANPEIILGAFAKLCKVIGSYVMSVRLSVRRAWNNSAPTRQILVKFHIHLVIENMSKKFPV